MTTQYDMKRLIQAALINLDPTLDVTEGSRAYQKVVQPILEVLGPDPLQADPQEFVRSRLQQEYPSVAVEGEGAIDDLVAKPHALIVGSLREQVLRVNQRQSVRNPSLLTDRDADALAANWFTGRDPGARAVVDARVFFSSPRALTITPANRWYTGSGLNFFTSLTTVITAEEMALNRSGDLFYAEVQVRAQFAGTEYSLEPGQLTGVTGVPDVVRVTNPRRGGGGLVRETTADLIQRTRRSLSERSTTNPRGIFARLTDSFGDIRDLEVVGYNDPEMERDLLTGAGNGKVAASGRAFVFGTYALFMASYEDRGDNEELFVSPGHELELHYGKLLYGLNPELRHEKFTVEAVPFDSRTVIEQLPNILLLRLDRAPENATTTALGGLPGFLPAVGAVLTTAGEITVSGIPGGIQAPVTPFGTIVVDDNQVHLGGHHDVWLRPTQQADGVVTIPAVDDEDPFLAGTTLQTLGTSATPNVVESTDVSLDWEVAKVREGQYLYILDGADRGAYRILKVRAKQLVLDANLTASDLDLHFKINDELVVDPVQPRVLKVPFGSTAPGTPLRTTIGSAILRVDVNLMEFGVEIGDIVRILEGDDEGDYIVTAWDSVLGGTGPVVDRVMSNSQSGLSYEVFSSSPGMQLPLVRVQPGGVSLLDSSDQPTDIQIPYALPVEGRALASVSGSKSKGTGEVGFTLPGLGPVFENIGEACPSDIDRFIEQLQDTQVPSNLAISDIIANRDAYSDDCLPCEGYIFCVTIDAQGIFINYDLPDSGKDLVNNITSWLTAVVSAFFPSYVAADPSMIEVVEGGIRINPNRTETPPEDPYSGDTPVQFEVCLPEELVGCCSNLYVGFPDFDLVALFAAFADWVKAYDSYVATGDASVLAPVLTTIMDLIPRDAPALSSAMSGDTLVLQSGPNRGGYTIDNVYDFSLEGTLFGTGLGLLLAPAVTEGQDFFWLSALLRNLAVHTNYDMQQTMDLFYGALLPVDSAAIKEAVAHMDEGLDDWMPVLKMTAVSIHGQFPVDPWAPFCELFNTGVPTIPPLPAPPTFDLDCYDDYEGNPKDPFDILVEFGKWFLEFLELLGLEIDTDFDVTFSEILGGLLNSLSTGYELGQSTCDATIRLYFVEPTTFEATGGNTCLGVAGVDGTQYPEPKRPTTFSTTVGSKEVLFAARPDVEPFQFIPASADGEPSLPTEWPRDITGTAEYTVNGRLVSDGSFTDASRPAPIAMGLKTGDILEIHPEILLLESTVGGINATTRIPAVTTQRGGSTLTLPPALRSLVDFTVDLAPRDLVFLEEGLDAKGYLVTKVVNAYQVEIDAPLTETTLSIIRDGVDGSYDGSGPNPTRFSSASAPFLSTDVGKYLTVYASHYPAMNGAYEILSVDPSGAWVELDVTGGSFPATETGTYWAVTRAPALAPLEASAGGTELVGMRPFRVYHRTSQRSPIAWVDDSLSSTSQLHIDVTDQSDVRRDHNPIHLSTKTPYRIIRPGLQRVSSTQMAQNREHGLYYVDIEVRSLEIGPQANVPKDQRFDAVFGTYVSDGYRYEVVDTNFTFSPQEELRLVFSGDFLPEGRDDLLSNRVPLSGQGLQVRYDYAPVVAQVHRFLLSQGERTILANPIARHFLPSYVYFTLQTRGASAELNEVADAIADAIEALSPVEEMSLAKMENVAREAGVTDWDHGTALVAVTHDLDRRLVGNRSHDRLGGSEPQYFNGSNRTSFFIPGPDYSPDSAGNYATEETVPDGERVRITQEVTPRNLR